MGAAQGSARMTLHDALEWSGIEGMPLIAQNSKPHPASAAQAGGPTSRAGSALLEGRHSAHAGGHPQAGPDLAVSADVLMFDPHERGPSERLKL